METGFIIHPFPFLDFYIAVGPDPVERDGVEGLAYEQIQIWAWSGY